MSDSNKPLNKYERLLNESLEVAAWIEDNGDCQVEDVRDISTFYENEEGLEFEVTIDTVKLLKDMREAISTLSEFIKTAPIDSTKRIPYGMPPLALTKEGRE